MPSRSGKALLPLGSAVPFITLESPDNNANAPSRIIVMPNVMPGYTIAIIPTTSANTPKINMFFQSLAIIRFIMSIIIISRSIVRSYQVR